MKDTNIDRIIRKVLQGTSSEEENDIFNEWKNASAINEKVFRKLYDEWQKKESPNKAINHEELTDKIWKAALNQSPHQRNKRYLWIYKTFKIAATLILVFFVYLFLKENLNRSNDLNENDQKVVSKESNTGQKSKLHLPDGTIIWLNSASSISYKKPFDPNLREVELTGEAYFQVAENSEQPFMVHFGNTQVKVLGTSFNISSYTDENMITISLIEGKIEVVNSGYQEKLTKGWVAKIDKETNTVKTFKDKVSKSIAWTEGILVFDEASFSDIFQRLQRWYGIKIIINGEPDRDMRFTGSFKQEYLNNVLENLISSDNISYKIDGEIVEITFK